MSDDELELKLLKGSAFELEGIKITPLKLKEIIDDIGYDDYLQLIKTVCIDKKQIKDISEEDLQKIETFDIFLCDNSLMEMLVRFFKVFLKYENVFYIEKNQGILFDYDGCISWVTRENYNKFLKVFREMYKINIPKQEEYNPGNDRARELIEAIKRKNEVYANMKAKSETNLASMISGVAWKSNNLNIVDIFNLTVYQLYDAYYRLEIVDNYTNTINGVYAGTVDGKKIDFKQLTWIKRYIEKN